MAFTTGSMSTPEEFAMKRKMIAAAAVAALALGASSPSFAQGVGVQVGPVGAGISFAPEQRTRIKEYVVKERVAPVTVRERISVGATLPADVELRAVPSDWGPSVSRYRYVYADDNVYFVEPSSRRVVHVLD
jgi:Protein of unknown function (DUF1236)